MKEPDGKGTADHSNPESCAGSGNIAGEALPRAHAGQPSAVPTPPTILAMATSFATSMARFASSGFKRAPAQTHKLRTDACALCNYRRQNRCTLCGCFVAKKAWLPHEDCPIGRWPI